MWTDAQEEKPSVTECQKMLLYETCISATLLVRLQQRCVFHTVDRQRLATPSSRLLPGKMSLNSSTMQLHNICPSTIFGYNQGNPEYSIASRQVLWASSDKHYSLFTFHWVFFVAPKPALGLTQAPETCKKQPWGCTMATACQVLVLGIFRSSLSLEAAFQSIRLGELRESNFFSKSFLLVLFWLSLLSLSFLLIEDTEFK